MLSEAAHDLGTALLAILAGLVGAAFLIPGQVQSTASTPDQPRPAPAPRPAPEPVLELSVFNQVPSYAWSLSQALDAWNSSGARVHFIAVDSPTADITVTTANPSPCGFDPDIAACTELGHSGPRTIWIVQQLDRYAEAELLAHELGHIIGLEHNTSGACAAMTRSLWENCDSPPSGMWRCKLLAEPDMEGAIALIGGTPSATEEPEFCPLGH